MRKEFLEAIDDTEFPIYVDNVHLEIVDIKEHQHQKGQLLYAEGGVLHVFTENKHWYLPARFYMWIPPNLPHHLVSTSNNVNVFNYYFTIDSADSSFYNKPNIYLVNDLLREMFLYTKDWNGGIAKEMRSKFSFMTAIKDLLPEINMNYELFPMQHPYPKDKRLLEIGKFINKNIESSYTLEQIAKQFGMSSRSLSRLFKEDMGFTYVKFVRAMRITKALELMTERKLNIYQIAIKVGYNSLSSFSNIFYRVTGVRPSEYMDEINKYREGEFRKVENSNHIM